MGSDPKQLELFPNVEIHEELAELLIAGNVLRGSVVMADTREVWISRVTDRIMGLIDANEFDDDNVIKAKLMQSLVK